MIGILAFLVSHTPIYLDALSRDEEKEARTYAIHKIALAPRSQGPKNALNLSTFSGEKLKRSQ
jgi:hypothetical protein